MNKIKTNLRKRIIATVIDYGLIMLFTYVYIMFFGEVNDEGGKSVTGLLAIPLPVLWFSYFVIAEASFGGTLGYQGFNLKVLTLERRKIEFTQALKRHLLDPIDFFYGIPAIIAIINSDKHQRLGDMWAKTIIVDTKDPEQYLDTEKTGQI